VWQDGRNGANWDVWWYDIAKKHEYQLTSSAANETEPDVWGTRACWTTDANGGANLDVGVSAYFDASIKNVTSYGQSGNQYRPRLYKDTMVWVDASSGSPEVFLYRYGANGLGVQVTNSPGNVAEPVMWSDTVVWFDTRNGTEDVYAIRLPSPSLSFSAPSTCSYGGTVKVSGYLKSWDGTPLSNRTIIIEGIMHSNLNQVMWFPITTAKTNSLGKYTASFTGAPTRFYARAYFDGDPDVFRRVSSQRTILPKVDLTKPVGKSTVSNTKSYTYYGYLQPWHSTGTTRVWLKCYRKVGGKYVLKKTYAATLSDYSTYSKYSAKIKLGTEGKWRVRAYYKQTFNSAKTFSSYKYVTSN
jgi:beta propeller repeat protein